MLQVHFNPKKSPDTCTTRENINHFSGERAYNKGALHAHSSAPSISYCFLRHCYQAVPLAFGSW